MILELSYCRSLTVVNSNKIIIQVQKIEGCRLKYGVIQFLTLFVGDAKARWENMQNFDDLENGNDWRTHWHVKDYKKHNKTHWQKIFKRYRLNLGPNKPDDPDFRERRTAPPKRRRTGRRRSSESSSSPPPPPPRRVLPPPIPFIDNYESIHVPKGTRLAQIQQERDRRLRARLGPKPPKIQKTQFESAEAKKAKRAARTTVAVLRDERGWTRFRSHRYTAPKFHNDPGYSDDVENQGENVESSDIEDWDSEDNDEEEEDETEGRKELWEMPQDQSTISRLSTAIETKKWCLVEELIKAGFQVHSLLFRRFNLVDEICSAANNIPEEFQNLFELLAQRGADIRMAYIDERTPTRLKRIEERDFYLDLIRKSLSDEIKVIYQKSITSGFPVITFPGNENGRILSIQRSSFRIEELEDDKKYAFVIVAMEWDGETFQVRQHLPLLTLRFNQEKIPIKCHETPLTEYPAFYSIHPTKGKNEFEIHLKQRMNGFIAVWPILVVEESSLEEKEDDETCSNCENRQAPPSSFHLSAVCLYDEIFVKRQRDKKERERRTRTMETPINNQLQQSAPQQTHQQQVQQPAPQQVQPQQTVMQPGQQQQQMQPQQQQMPQFPAPSQQQAYQPLQTAHPVFALPRVAPQQMMPTQMMYQQQQYPQANGQGYPTPQQHQYGYYTQF